MTPEARNGTATALPPRPVRPSRRQEREALLLLAQVVRGEGVGEIRMSGSRVVFVVVSERDKRTV
jgi:hypothetical protein